MRTNADTLINREEFDRCSLELWHEEVVKYGENDQSPPIRTQETGQAMSTNAERWKQTAEKYQKRAEKLAKELTEATKEREDLSDTLDHIAELSAPERVLSEERQERIERMLEMLLNRLFGPEALAAIGPAQKPEDEEENGEEENDENGETQEDEEALEEARHK